MNQTKAKLESTPLYPLDRSVLRSTSRLVTIGTQMLTPFVLVIWAGAARRPGQHLKAGVLPVTVTILVLWTAFAVWRLVTLRVVLSVDGVEVHNVWSTRRIRWSEIASVQPGRYRTSGEGPDRWAPVLILDSGRTQKMSAFAASWGSVQGPLWKDWKAARSQAAVNTLHAFCVAAGAANNLPGVPGYLPPPPPPQSGHKAEEEPRRTLDVSDQPVSAAAKRDTNSADEKSPSPRRGLKVGSASVALGVILIVSGLVWIEHLYSRSDHLETDGVRTTATITRIPSNEWPVAHVCVDYTAGPLAERPCVPVHTVSGLRVGQRLTVAYDRQHPSHAVIVGNTGDPTSFLDWAPFLAGLALLIYGLVALIKPELVRLSPRGISRRSGRSTDGPQSLNRTMPPAPRPPSGSSRRGP